MAHTIVFSGDWSMRHMLWAWLAMMLLPGCATIMQGKSQNVTVLTDPTGASCTMERDGQVIGAVPVTPGSVRIDKGKSDITVTCDRQGFETTKVRHVSEFGGATLANAIAGGLIGVVVDAASGANFPYPDEVRMILQPPGAPPVQQPTPAKVLPNGSAPEPAMSVTSTPPPATETKP